jgi:hypothetical protein
MFLQRWIDRLTFERFAAVLFFIVIGTIACLMPAQNDTWWQLKAGEDIVAMRAVPLRDAFSFTQEGQYWPNHEWLAQVVLYGLYRAGGLPAVTLGAAAAVTAAWLIIWQLTPGTAWRRLWLSAAVSPVFVIQWSLRPQVFTLLFLAITLWLLLKEHEWWLPPLFVIWANMHGGVVLGIALLGGVTAARLLHARQLRIRPLAIAAACLMATTVTPLGVTLWTEVPASLARLRAYQVIEWQSPRLTQLGLAPYWLALVALPALIGIVRPWRSSTPLPLTMSFAALALLPVSLSAVRNAAPFVLLALPAMGALLLERFPPRPARVRRQRPLAHAIALSAAALAAVVNVASAWSAPADRLQWRPMSPGAIAAVAECPGQLYNGYNEGGYVIWFVPGRKVFLDSRQDPFPPALVMEHIRVERSGDFDETFKRHSIDCAFVPANSRVAESLTKANWRRTYTDASWAIFQE